MAADGLGQARLLLPEAILSAVERLPGGSTAVHRARAEWPDGSSSTVIVKAFRNPVGWARESAIAARFERVLGELRTGCLAVGIPVEDTLVDAFRARLARLGDAAASALSPGDTCPDNNVLTGEGGRDLLAVVDFEGASWRHIAWDAAYLRVPWPSCRCAWRLPGDVAENAVARYRNALAGMLPHVSTVEFDRDLAAATDLWSVLYSAWLLPSALAGEPPSGSRGQSSPGCRSLLLHRLDVTRRSSESRVIAAFADRLRATLTDRWGEQTPALAPAFQDIDFQ